MMIQQSNCFIVVERGFGMQNLMQERQLASAGESRQGSNMGGGQMVAADFLMTPAVVFSENNAGGAGGAVAGLLGRRAAMVAAVAGGIKFKEAQTSMLVAEETGTGLNSSDPYGPAAAFARQARFPPAPRLRQRREAGHDVRADAFRDGEAWKRSSHAFAADGAHVPALPSHRERPTHRDVTSG